jgi:hypothetical protein
LWALVPATGELAFSLRDLFTPPFEVITRGEFLAAQAQLYPLIVEAMALLEALT